MRTKAEIHFLELIKENRIYVIESKEAPFVDVYIDNIKRAINRIASKRNGKERSYSFAIYHNGHMLTLGKVIYMTKAKHYVPEGYQVIHKNLDKYDFSFNNLEIMDHQEHQNYLVSSGVYTSVSEEIRKLRSSNAIKNNPQTKLSLSKVEYYRCQYHQQKMTVNAIMKDSGMTRRSIDNLLKFRSYSFCPITGEFDKELHLYYTSEDAASYKRKIDNPSPKKPKVLKVKVKEDDKVVEKKVCDLVKPKKKSKDSIIANIKPMKTPLNFNDCAELVRIKDKYDWVLSRIAREVCLGERTVEKHMYMYKFFTKIFPNFKLIESDKRVSLFDKFKDKYGKYFDSTNEPDITPYSFSFLITIEDDVVKDMYEDYKYGASLSKLMEDYDYDETDIKLAIIEYDRYRRPVYEKGLTPEQFHKVYK